jgi:hypothetical protein
VSSVFSYSIQNLEKIQRDMKKIPKEANAELRKASRQIANEAIEYAGPWGDKIASSVRSGSDRVPKVQIGYKRKAFSGGASSIDVRYPSDSGQARNSPAPFERTKWIAKAKSKYQPGAKKEWDGAVDAIVTKWKMM